MIKCKNMGNSMENESNCALKTQVDHLSYKRKQFILMYIPFVLKIPDNEVKFIAFESPKISSLSPAVFLSSLFEIKKIWKDKHLFYNEKSIYSFVCCVDFKYPDAEPLTKN